MRSLDAATTTPGERLAEIAELLARGVQRLLAAEIKAAASSRNLQVRLDDLGVLEAPCGSNPKSPEPSK